MFNEIRNRLLQKDIEVSITDEAKKLISEEGFDPLYGARPLRRAIQRQIEDKIAEMMLEGKVNTKKPLVVSAEKNKIVIK